MIRSSCTAFRAITRVATAALTMLIGLLLCRGPVFASAPGVSIAKEDIIFVPAPFVHVYEVIQTMQLQTSAHTEGDVTFPLPSGFQNVQVVGVSKSAWRLSKNGVTVHRLLAADGTGRVTLTYTVPQDAGQGASITLTTPYPVYTAHLYLPIGNSALSAPDLQAATQTATISGQQFRVFTRYGIQASEQWPISLQELPGITSPVSTNGLPVIGASDNGANGAVGAIINLVIAALVLAVGFIGLRSTGRNRTPLSPEQALLQSWSNVEQQYASGRLDATEYQRRREELKGKLVDLRLADVHQS